MNIFIGYSKKISKAILMIAFAISYLPFSFYIILYFSKIFRESESLLIQNPITAMLVMSFIFALMLAYLLLMKYIFKRFFNFSLESDSYYQ